MDDHDLIRRGDALAAVQVGDTVTKMQARIRAIPSVDADPVCTDCGGTGITYQTERRCACQPALTHSTDGRVEGLREAAALIQERRDGRYKFAAEWVTLDEASDAILARAAELEKSDE